MKNDQDLYRQILKATSIFGGVQFLGIIISIIHSKFIAVLLGPAGMGISGLLTSATALINSLTSFGLGTSAVRDVAESADDAEIVSVIVSVIKKTGMDNRHTWDSCSRIIITIIKQTGLRLK
jgi:O-antigen/teichoic acid export membrane protein